MSNEFKPKYELKCNFRNLLKEEGITQEEFAKRCGIYQWQVSRLVNGEYWNTRYMNYAINILGIKDMNKLFSIVSTGDVDKDTEKDNKN